VYKRRKNRETDLKKKKAKEALNRETNLINESNQSIISSYQKRGIKENDGLQDENNSRYSNKIKNRQIAKYYYSKL